MPALHKLHMQWIPSRAKTDSCLEHGSFYSHSTEVLWVISSGDKKGTWFRDKGRWSESEKSTLLSSSVDSRPFLLPPRCQISGATLS